MTETEQPEFLKGLKDVPDRIVRSVSERAMDHYKIKPSRRGITAKVATKTANDLYSELVSTHLDDFDFEGLSPVEHLPFVAHALFMRGLNDLGHVVAEAYTQISTKHK